MKRPLFITIVIIILLPIALNWAMQLPQITTYVGEAKDWLSFWGSYLSAAVAAVMIIYTAHSLKQNDKTLEEMKREWMEERRARLVVSITSNDWLYLIKIKNIGKMPAYDIQMGFNKEFIGSLFAKSERKIYNNLMDKRFSLDAGESKYFSISPIYGSEEETFLFEQEAFKVSQINKWLDSFRHKLIVVEAAYNYNKYFVHYETTLDDYLVSDFKIKEDTPQELSQLVKGIVKNNNQYYPIQKSLDIIAKYCEQKNNEK